MHCIAINVLFDKVNDGQNFNRNLAGVGVRKGGTSYILLICQRKAELDQKFGPGGLPNLLDIFLAWSPLDTFSIENCIDIECVGASWWRPQLCCPAADNSDRHAIRNLHPQNNTKSILLKVYTSKLF